MRKEGYYSAVLADERDACVDVIVYWNGTDILTVGDSAKLKPTDFLYISEKPILDYAAFVMRTSHLKPGSKWL